MLIRTYHTLVIGPLPTDDMRTGFSALSTKECRLLNDGADKCASRLAKDHFHFRADNFNTSRSAAEGWSERALLRLKTAATRYYCSTDQLKSKTDKWVT